jgi:uncharacterized alpha-E superfamily protein
VTSDAPAGVGLDASRDVTETELASPPTRPIGIISPGPVLLSRVAGHLYWAGRYLERAESTARLVRTHTELFVDLPRSVGLGWAPLLAVTGSRQAFDDGYEAVIEDDVVAFLLAEPRYQGSVVASVQQARENLRITRGLIPRRVWEVVNETNQWVAATAVSGCARGGRMMWCEEVLRRCHTVAGSTTATMSRDLAYAFVQIGRLLERADMSTRVLDVQAGILMGTGREGLTPFTDLTWMSMLRSLGGEQMYRRQMGGVISAPDAVRFVLRDPAFPRSVEHCLSEVARWLGELPYQYEPVDASGSAYALLASVSPDDMDVNAVHQFVDDLQLALGALHVELERSYFPAAQVASS